MSKILADVYRFSVYPNVDADDELGRPITNDPLGDLLRNKEMEWHDDDWCEDVD